MKPRIAPALALTLIALPPSARLAAAPLRSADPVVLVVGLDGNASVGASVRSATPLRLFDKLPVGATLRTGPASSVRLVFRGGARYALRASSRARIERNALRALSGSADRLTSLPATLVLAPIAPEDSPGDRFPTFIIRTLQITGVYPRGDVTLEPANAVLHFDPVSGAPTYRVQVTDQKTGNLVYSLDTPATEIPIPADKLKPGRRYSWHVETVGRIGSKAEGQGGFLTYTPEAQQARAGLDALLAGEPELDALFLKIAVDLNLGRYREVYQGLQEAARRLPQDPGLAAAEQDWKSRLGVEKAAPATPPESHPSPRSPAPSSSGGRSSW